MLRQLLAATLVITCLFVAPSLEAQETKTDTVQVDSKVFETVEIESTVNIVQWRRHLESALIKPLKKATKKGMKAGIYTVSVRFLVEKDGSISVAQALNDPGYGLAEASENVIKTGPRWRAGEQNGKKVRSYHTQPITFQIAEE